MSIPPKAPPVYKPAPPRVAAPAAYRPNQSSAPSAQLKATSNFQLETRPAPPVYRPQQARSGVQTKTVKPINLETRRAPAISQSQQSVNVPFANPSLQNIRTPRPGIHFPTRKQPAALFDSHRRPIQRMRMEMAEFPKPETPIARLESTVRSLKGPKVTESGFFAPYTPKEKADRLFADFLGMGVGYDLGSGFTSVLLGVGAKPLKPGEEMRKAFSGNCHAMANGLATVLKMAKIPAEPREIRAEVPGRAFIVHAPNFVDKQVAGHIYKEGVLWPQRYLFTNHSATWVPSLNTYYDLMSGAKYQSLDDFIEMDLRQIDQAGDLFEGQYNGEKWHLQRRTDIKGSARPLGGFFRFDMSRAPVLAEFGVAAEEPYDPTIYDSYQAYVPKSVSPPKNQKHKTKSVIL